MWNVSKYFPEITSFNLAVQLQTLNLDFRIRLVKCFTVWLRYMDDEDWARDRFKVLEMWIWQWTEEIRWVDTINNADVLKQIKRQ